MDRIDHIKQMVKSCQSWLNDRDKANYADYHKYIDPEYRRYIDDVSYLLHEIERLEIKCLEWERKSKNNGLAAAIAVERLEQIDPNWPTDEAMKEIEDGYISA